MMDEVTDKPKQGRPKKIEEAVKLGTKEALELVPAGINADYEITRYQRDNCYVFRAWSHAEAKGRQSGEIERDHNISYGKTQFLELAGSGKKKKRSGRTKKTCSPMDYMRGVWGDKCELINEPKY